MRERERERERERLGAGNQATLPSRAPYDTSTATTPYCPRMKSLTVIEILLERSCAPDKQGGGGRHRRPSGAPISERPGPAPRALISGIDTLLEGSCAQRKGRRAPPPALRVTAATGL